MSKFDFLEKYAVDGQHYDSSHELDKLSQSKNIDDRWIVAMHSKIPETASNRLANDSSPGILHSLSRNNGVSPKSLNKLASNSDILIRINVAANTNIDSSTVTKLIRNTNDFSDIDRVHERLLKNPSPAIQKHHIAEIMKHSINDNDVYAFIHAAKHSLSDTDFVNSVPEKYPEFHKRVTTHYGHLFKFPISKNN